MPEQQTQVLRQGQTELSSSLQSAIPIRIRFTRIYGTAGASGVAVGSGVADKSTRMSCGREGKLA